MSTVLRAKGRNAKKMAAMRANKRTPQPDTHYRSNIVFEIMKYLYKEQYRVWQEKLKILSVENQQSYGFQNTYSQYSLIWDNKTYVSNNFENQWADARLFIEHWTAPQTKEYSYHSSVAVPLNPKWPEFAERMREIAEELDDLYEESYEVQRFLINLFTFQAPPKRIKKILGPTLGRALEKAIDHYCEGLSDEDWTMNGNNEFAMKTFVDANKNTILKMNQRVMLNMTTL